MKCHNILICIFFLILLAITLPFNKQSTIKKFPHHQNDQISSNNQIKFFSDDVDDTQTRNITKKIDLKNQNNRKTSEKRHSKTTVLHGAFELQMGSTLTTFG